MLLSPLQRVYDVIYEHVGECRKVSNNADLINYAVDTITMYQAIQLTRDGHYKHWS